MTLERALTLKEWEAQQAHTTSLKQRIQWAVSEVDADGWLGRHGLAALCLRGMPYGFTAVDVDRLRRIANARTSVDAHAGIVVGESVAEWLTSLADRIEALLPPQPPETL